MSYTLYFQAHQKGEDQYMATKEIMECFAPFISEKNEFGFEVMYDKLNSSFIYIDLSKDRCSGFSVSRPCKDDRLFKALFRIAQLGNVICLFPEGNAHVFNDKTIENLPADLKSAFEEGHMTYKILRTEEEYLESIKNN